MKRHSEDGVGILSILSSRPEHGPQQARFWLAGVGERSLPLAEGIAEWRDLAFRAILLLAIIACGVAPGLAQTTDWKRIPVPTLPPFHPQEPKRLELPNGMIIFLQEDHELPLIDGIARIRGGSRSEPANKAGMLDIYGEAWRTGGTKSQTGDQLDDYLEIRAAKVETGDNADSTSISWSCLKGDFDDVFPIFADLLRNPEFRQDKIELAQKGMDDSISRRNDEVSEIAGRESGKLAYGKDNPYVREPEYATVAAVTRQDLLDWHRDHVAPNNIILGIVGDFDSAVMEARLRQTFGDWAKGTPAEARSIEFTPAKAGYYLVTKPDVNQSSIRMVELGIRRDNPDYYATQVFNEAFGGGFSSRLFRNLRTVKGLAYDVGGGIGSAFDHPGMVRIEMGTKSATTAEAVEGIFAQMDELKRNPLSAEEIHVAKDSILNSFVFNFDSPEKILRERMAYEFYGYPADFLERYRSGIEKVQPTDVARVAEKYLHKDQLAVLVVGNPPDFDKPLDSLGPVTNVDITIPPPSSKKPEPLPPPPTASNPEGKALAAKVVQAMGGLDKLQSVKALRAEFNEQESENGPGTPVKATIQFPDRMHVEVETPQGLLTVVVTPDAGYTSQPGRGVQTMPASANVEGLNQIHRDLIYIGQHLSDPSFIFSGGGTEKVGDAEAQILDIVGSGTRVRWLVDPATGHVLRERYEAATAAGPFQGETDFENWKTTDGITLPVTRKNKQNGKLTSVVESTKVEFNPAIDPKLFDKPTN